MPFEPTGGRANAVLERKNNANADMPVEMFAIRRSRFIALERINARGGRGCGGRVRIP